MKIFNTLSREIEEFFPLEGNTVRIYACGPTVYAMPHVGNFRSFFLADLVKRYLIFCGYQVILCMNITDIDDKTIRDSEKEDIKLEEFTEKYSYEFFRGLKMLNILPAEIYPRATDHIPNMLDLIEKLEKNGYAYEKDGSVYFNIKKMKKYGHLSKIDLANLEIGKSVDVDEYDKENPIDFVLWKKSSDKEKERNIFWETKWGPGRPGWHIECSAMSMKYLGDTFDIHLGGVDLIFPHHENEIAQSVCATGKPFVKYWIHGGHLIVEGKKMSKSAGNYFTLDEIMNKFDVNVIRYFFMSRKYRDTLNYSEKGIQTVVANVDRLRSTLGSLTSILSTTDLSETATIFRNDVEKELMFEIDHEYKGFITAMNNDLDTPLALQTLIRMSHSLNVYLTSEEKNLVVLQQATTKFKQLLGVFGLFDDIMIESNTTLVPELMNLIIEVRKDLRAKKHFEFADKIRSELIDRGIQLKDTPQGTTWEINK